VKLPMPRPLPPAIDKRRDTPPAVLSGRSFTSPRPPSASAVSRHRFAREVLFTVDRNTSVGTEEQIAQRLGLAILERHTSALLDRRTVRARIRGRSTVEMVVEALVNEPDVNEAQPNFAYHQQQGPPADSGLQYSLTKLNLAGTPADADGKGVTVAVIDTAIDATHPDFAHLDLRSIDAFGTTVIRHRSHGTAIAGILAADGVVKGIAPHVRLLAVRAFDSSPGDQRTVSSTFVLLRSLDLAIENSARIINMSFAGPEDGLVAKAVAAAARANVHLVSAAGNLGPDAPPAFPAAYPEVISVTAIGANDERYPAANIGTYIGLSAPGVDVIVPAPRRTHAVRSGTSMAAAHVAGVLALMLERNPDLSPEEGRRALLGTAIDLGPPGRDAEFGAGRADAKAALEAAGEAR